MTGVDAMTQAARLRILTRRRDAASPVEAADQATSLADARTALCLARGVPPEDIHPASGHDLSYPAYERVRGEWAELVAADSGLTRRCVEAGRYWQTHRPAYLDKQPWPVSLAVCDTCGDPEAVWPLDHPLHRQRSGQCGWCRQMDIEHEQQMDRRCGDL